MGAVALGLSLMAGGCEPPHLTDTGVVRVVGGLGLGPGRLSYPRAIAAEPGGAFFVIDKSGRVQRFGRDGTFEASWRMPDISAGKPVGLAVHPDGRVFVADTHCHRVMIFDREGTELGTFGRLGNGDGEFQLPTDVAFDRQGFIYVSEYYGNDRITRWSPDLEFVAAIGVEPAAGARLNRPTGLIVDDEQTLWVADACNHRLVRFSLEGAVLGTFGNLGREAGQMRYPYDISLTPDGSLLVCEYGGDRLQWFSKDGRSLRVWGHSGRDPGALSGPWGVTSAAGGLVYIVDSLNNRVQVLKP